MQRETNVSSFDECKAAGNPIQYSYPEVCLTKDGKRFVNPNQDKAHQDSLTGEEDLIPPTNPELLVLDVEEWKVRIPLTMQTFDLMYAYLENGGEEYLLFTYKRLVRDGLCAGDIGMRMHRSLFQNQAPFSPNKPPATAHIDKYYYYVTYVGAPCYDPKNADHFAKVSPMAGDKTLIEATTALLANTKPMPLQ